MNIWKLSTIGFCFLTLVACDEQMGMKPDGNQGDIVWVGNGLRLESSHGVLLDMEDAEFGDRSVLVTVDQFLPVVRSADSNESVPVRLDWASKDVVPEPAVQLKRLDRSGECSRYVSQDGNLVCSDLLESLPIKKGSVPQGLVGGAVLYVDLFDSLHHVSAKGEDVLVAGQVDQYFLNDQNILFVQSKTDSKWSCHTLTASGFVVCGSADLSIFSQILKTESSESLGVSFTHPEGSGVYKLGMSERQLQATLLKAFPSDWTGIVSRESPDLLKVLSVDNEFWIRITSTGYEFMDLTEPQNSEGLSLQAHREFSVTKTKSDQGFEFELCRRSETPIELDVSKCTKLQRSDSYRFTEVLLHYPEALDRPQLIAVSELIEAQESETRAFLLSVFEVHSGKENDPYMIQLSERSFDSRIKALRDYDLRKPKTDSPD